MGDAKDGSNGFFDPADAITPVENHMTTPPTPLTHEQREKLFGKFEFRSAPVPGDQERIIVLGQWAFDNLVTIQLPIFTPGMPRHARVHRAVAKQIAGFFEALSLAGLLPLVKSFDGAYCARYKRGRAGGGAEALSNHAWGTAFDVNARWNAMGTSGAPLGSYGSTRRLIPVAYKFGLLNGAQFHAPYTDAMHFEVYKVMP